MSRTSFDYIIVGAGSAGCVLANRLSADPTIRILLIEAGPRDRNPWIHIPGGYYRLIYHPTLSWNFTTEPEPGLDGRSLIWPRGRTLGGSSAINAMVYIRGQPEDFNGWRQRGCDGWGWHDVLPYFIRAEDQARGANELHGTGGPLGVSDITEGHLLSDAFIDAAVEWGLPRSDDFNGPSQEGVGYFQLTTRNTRRCSSAVGYLRPVERRPNLVVLTSTLVTRLLIENGRAVGVRVSAEGRPESDYRCTAEVILSSGAIKSPHLLLLSGIGPADQLRAHGIPVLHDLPGVGHGLQDHLQLKMLYRVEGVESLNEVRRNPLKMAREGLRFALFRRGPLANGPSMAGGFACTDPAYDLPDMQFHFNPVSGDRPGHFHPFPGCSPIVSQLRPESRGWLRLRSADPRDQPSMCANYLDAEADRRCLVASMRICREIMAKPAMQRFKAQEIGPGPRARTDAELLAYARAAGYTQFHPISSCRMGVDPLAVVDSELRVRGIEGLRVADASIMPMMISGNTNATCIMIGEKAADLIKGQPMAAAA
jgi:choline dehydrogenase